MTTQTISGIREHMIIGGQPVEQSQGERIPVYNPATGQVIAQQPEAGVHGVDLAVKAAHQALTLPLTRCATSPAVQGGEG